MPMPFRLNATTARDLQALFRDGSMGTWTDGQLMAQSLDEGDAREAAFRALVIRHGPMVLGVCRRILDDPHAAEDAFQATFLVLVKKARTLRNRDRVTSWLYGVAQRVARKARAESARRRVVESRLVPEVVQGDGDHAQAELRAVIDEEIGRLPEHYRLPLILCHLEGMRHHEAAERLGCPVGTVESRLSRARDQLRARLVRRGLAPAGGGFAALLLATDARASLPSLVASTIQTAFKTATVGGAKHSIWPGWLQQACALKSLSSACAGIATLCLMICGGVSLVVTDGDQARGTQVSEIARTLLKPEPQLVVKQAQAPSSPSPPPSAGSAPATPARREPYTRALPLADLTIDGRLDDWPANLTRYPITNRLRDNKDYDIREKAPADDPNAFFMTGYSLEKGLIYMAVVVHDKDLVVDNKDVTHTDSVEIYIDGLMSDYVCGEPPTDQTTGALSAAHLPVVQYVAIPGAGPAYGKAGDGNPALMYGKISKSSTTMRYLREGELTTYEWAVQPFDRYPDRPTRLERGKSLGLEVAVVDRDSERNRPYFYTWGAPPVGFKGFDAGQLGELKLVGDP
jgi:RNA polymerase sigma factor (sigma-70 family)